MSDPDGVFADLHRRLAVVAGARLFTVTKIDPVMGLARRIHSSHPVDYPVSGTKPIRADGWTRQVIDGQRSFVANSTAEFAVYFPDHALINRLGCASALNVPVVDEGRVVATINILDDAGRFMPQVVGAVEALIAAEKLELLAAIRMADMPE
jgi:hypothetical protein